MTNCLQIQTVSNIAYSSRRLLPSYLSKVNKMWSNNILLIVMATIVITVTAKKNLSIGGLFEEGTGFSKQAFIHATEWVNRRGILPQFKLVPNIQDADMFNSWLVSTNVCQMMKEGVAGVFGPHSADTSDPVQSLCDAMEIPHVEMRWDSRQRRGSCLINLYPHPSAMGKVFLDIVKQFKWTSFALLYEDNEGLVRLNGLLSHYDHKAFSITMHQLNESGNYRQTMIGIRNSDKYNIVIDCSVKVMNNVLLQAQQVGLLVREYNIIITCLDFHTIDWEPFMYGAANITGVRLVDPSSHAVRDIIDFWSARENYFDITGESLNAETAMVHDAVLVYAKAIELLTQSRDLQVKPLICGQTDNWQHGYSIINYMKMSEVTGLTGLIKFDNEGFRTDFELNMYELTQEGIVSKATWNNTRGINFTHIIANKETKNVHDLRNHTLVVMISLVDPHAMYAENKDKLEGNNKFEGMGIDMIRELANMIGFNYTFRLQETGGSGKPVAENSDEWNGMIGEIMHDRAHLAISDITITEDRLRVVDFTDPYIALGISILHRKAIKTPYVFSFMIPFSPNLWYALLIACVGVALLLYLIARISPAEWQNPYPCRDDEDLEEFENQFSLNNSLWWVTGCVMQQGSELAPNSMSTRTLAGVWSVFTLIITNSYTAFLSSSLLIENNNPLLKSINDLANQRVTPDSENFIRYGAVKDGSTETFFKLSNQTTYQKMWLYMKDHYKDVMVGSNKEGVEKVLGGNNYAFLMESASIDYEVQRECSLRQVGQPLDSKGYGIVMPKQAWFRNIISASMVRLQESGKISELYKKWWREKRGGDRCKAKPPSEEATRLGLDNVGGVFMVLFCGCFVGTFVSLMELMYETYVKKYRGPYWKELWKELVFVVSFNKNIKRLKPEEDEEVEEEAGEESKSEERNTPPMESP